MTYLDSDRNANYVEIETYIHYLADLRDRFEWADLDAETYQPLRVRPEAVALDDREGAPA